MVALSVEGLRESSRRLAKRVPHKRVFLLAPVLVGILVVRSRVRRGDDKS
jgi:hypothetical protein